MSVLFREWPLSILKTILMSSFFTTQVLCVVLYLPMTILTAHSPGPSALVADLIRVSVFYPTANNMMSRSTMSFIPFVANLLFLVSRRSNINTIQLKIIQLHKLLQKYKLDHTAKTHSLDHKSKTIKCYNSMNTKQKAFNKKLFLDYAGVWNRDHPDLLLEGGGGRLMDVPGERSWSPVWPINLSALKNKYSQGIHT